MAKKLPRKISAKKIRFIWNNKEWLKYWRCFRKNIGAFWPMSILLIGIILGVFITLFYASVHVPEWTLHELGIQHRIELSSPSLSNQGNIVLNEERANVFEKLGPVGDFFGGVINPILTFFSIFLLLLSIKTQREELKETRKEMKAATEQAERTADAATRSILITQIGMRPFLKFYAGHSPEVVFVKENNYNEDFVFCKIMLFISNIGKSSAVIKEISINCYFGQEIEDRCLFSTTSVPIGFNEKDRITVETVFKSEDWFHGNRSASLLNARSINIIIKYEDAFEISYVFSYELKPLDGHRNNETTIVFSAVWPSFNDRVEYKKVPSKNNNGEKDK